jgi:hypothetical protein
MKSIFDLIDTTDELSSSNAGLANLQYDEIVPLRSIVDSNAVQAFGNGVITLRWHNPSNRWYLPSRSYIKMVIDIKQGTGGTDNDPLLVGDNIAPSMGLPHGLFSQMSYLISDKTVDTVTNNYSQISSYLIRQERSREWLHSTGTNTNFWTDSFLERKKMITQGSFNREVIHADNVQDADQDFYTRAETFANTNVDEGADTVAVAVNGQITWNDNAGADLDLRLSDYLKVGNLILFKYTNQAYYSIHRITAVAQVVLTVSPSPAGVAIGADVANNGLFDLRVVKDESQYLTRRNRTFEVYFQPCLSIYNLSHGIPGGSKHELQLLSYPNEIYQRCGIESLANKTHLVDYRFEVKDLRLYNCVCDGPNVMKKEFFLDLTQTRCQILELTSAQPTQYAVDVSPSTTKIGMAFQDNRVLQNSILSNTKFNVGLSKKLELGLSDAYVRYGSVQFPNPEYSVSYNSGVALANNVASNTDKLTELFHRNIMYNGGYYDSSQETYKEWRNRGIYMAFPIARTATSRESRAYVKLGFSNLSNADQALLVTNGRLLIFDTFKKVAIIKMQSGKVYDVLLNDV